MLATTTPDQTVPATAATVQHELGLRCGAFDLNAACSGLRLRPRGRARLHRGRALDQVLVVGAETLSRIVDWEDRGTAILFGDGAGAVVLEAVEGPGSCSAGTSVPTARSAAALRRCRRLHPDGRARGVPPGGAGDGRLGAASRWHHAGVSADDLALVVPHQANMRIIDAACDRLGIPMERTVDGPPPTPATRRRRRSRSRWSTRSTHGRVHDGDLVLLVGFGAGMTSASAVLARGAPSDGPAERAA